MKNKSSLREAAKKNIIRWGIGIGWQSARAQCMYACTDPLAKEKGTLFEALKNSKKCGH